MFEYIYKKDNSCFEFAFLIENVNNLFLLSFMSRQTENLLSLK